MKIVQINSNLSESSAPNRLRLALKKAGIETTLLTMATELKDEHIRKVSLSLGYRILRKLDSLLWRLEYGRNYSIEEGMPFSFYRVGVNLSRHALVREADIIEFHWVCGSFLSVRGMERIVRLKKPVIIICHDNWHFTGGCHVRMGCEEFTGHCGCCPQLHSSKKDDWSYRLLKSKEKAFRDGNITVVSPSRWMDENVKRSSLFKNLPHTVIPNALDVSLFQPLDKGSLRKKYGIGKASLVIVYGALNASSTPYKGYQQLLQALDLFEKEYPGREEIKALVFGAARGPSKGEGRIGIRYMGYLNQKQMAEIYNCGDVYVVPSLEDSFNYTVAESLACETPVASFATGGIPDILDHKVSGYLAGYNDPADLARGIRWILEHNEDNVLGRAGRKKVMECFGEEAVAQQFKQLYKKLMEKTDDA